MRKLLAIALGAAMLTSLAACSTEDPLKTVPQEPADPAVLKQIERASCDELADLRLKYSQLPAHPDKPLFEAGMRYEGEILQRMANLHCQISPPLTTESDTS